MTLTKEGEQQLGPAVEASVYRIVQESLTNTLRHAGAARADVLVRVGPERVEVEVTRRRARPGRLAGTRQRPRDRSGCGNGPGCWAARWRPGHATTGGFRVDGAAASRRSAMTIRVLIADDQALVRAGFRMILEAPRRPRGRRRGGRRRAGRPAGRADRGPTWC